MPPSGTQVMAARNSEAIRRRLLAKAAIDPETGCWVWQGAKDHKGYGKFGVADQSMRMAHRVSYELIIGPIPEGLQLDHLCHTDDPACAGGSTCPHRACINPAHLEPVTARINQLRGGGQGGLNARKTHCPKGHPYDAANTWIHAGGGRRCRACRAEYDRKRVNRPRRRSARS